TSQGSPAARFHRALKIGNPLLVRAAAAEMPYLGLGDALRACLVLAVGEPEAYGRWAARWVARYATECTGCDLAELSLLVAALRSLTRPGRAAAGLQAIMTLAAAHDRRDVVAAIEWW